MPGMMYLMENNIRDAKSKIGHRTKLSAENVREEVDNEYGDEYRCVAVYNLGTEEDETTEFVMKRMRSIIAIAAGTLEDIRPEYYNISPENALSILRSIAELRRDAENITIF